MRLLKNPRCQIHFDRMCDCEIPEKKKIVIFQCKGKCGHTFLQCLKRRHQIDLKENQREMEWLEKNYSSRGRMVELALRGRSE